MNNDEQFLRPRSVKIPKHKRVSNQDGTLSFRDLNQSSFLHLPQHGIADRTSGIDAALEANFDIHTRRVSGPDGEWSWNLTATSIRMRAPHLWKYQIRLSGESCLNPTGGLDGFDGLLGGEFPVIEPRRPSLTGSQNNGSIPNVVAGGPKKEEIAP